MQLLGAHKIREFIGAEAPQRLRIKNFDEAWLEPTWYYFRLGSRVARCRPGAGVDTVFDHVVELSEDKNPVLTLAPHESVRIRSYEGFGLDNTIMGIFGTATDLGERGLHLINSPFIDPLFPGENSGYLDLGLQNLTHVSVRIRYKSVVGKVAFFDTSDTRHVEKVGADVEKKFAKRRMP